jgi:hypothetical protein
MIKIKITNEILNLLPLILIKKDEDGVRIDNKDFFINSNVLDTVLMSMGKYYDSISGSENTFEGRKWEPELENSAWEVYEYTVENLDEILSIVLIFARAGVKTGVYSRKESSPGLWKYRPLFDNVKTDYNNIEVSPEERELPTVESKKTKLKKPNVIRDLDNVYNSRLKDNICILKEDEFIESHKKEIKEIIKKNLGAQSCFESIIYKDILSISVSVYQHDSIKTLGQYLNSYYSETMQDTFLYIIKDLIKSEEENYIAY